MPLEMNSPEPSPDFVESAIAAYGRAARAALRRDPVRQALRMLRRRFRERPAAAAERAGAVAVPSFLRPPSYRYRGYGGPWLEEHFYQQWDGSPPGGADYLPVFFDGLYFQAQCHAYLPSEFAARYRALWRLLRRIEATDRAFFSVVGMYDFPLWEWPRFPRNLVIFGGTGQGDIPFPQLKGDRPFARPPKDILVSFMGSLDGISNHLGVRAEMRRVFDGVARFGQGDDWEAIMGRSHFSLCPRGLAPTSFRLAEALSLCSIPIYLWRERSGLPYEDELDWSSFAVVAEAGRMEEARRAVLAFDPAAIRAMQDRIERIYPDYFTYDSVCARIRRRAAGWQSREDAESLTAGRTP